MPTRTLKIGIAHTSREGWYNKETELNRHQINQRVRTLCELNNVELFSTDDLEPSRRTMFQGGREVPTSNYRYISSIEDAANAARYFSNKDIDGLLISFCNYGHEEAVAKLARQLNVPVLLWGPRDEQICETEIYRKTDTQCGLFAASKVLRRLGISFSYIENCRISENIFEKGFTNFLEVTSIVKSFRKARIAQISVRPQQFSNLMVNEGELLERFNIEIVPVTGAELLDTIKMIQRKNVDKVEELAAEIEREMSIMETTDTRTVAAVELGFAKIAERYGCSAIASDCWHEIRREYGFGPWYVFGDLYDKGLPCTNECDIHGAITSLLAVGATRYSSPAFLADLTMRHPNNENAELLWHMGFAKTLREEGSKGKIYRTGEANIRLKQGDLTVLRFDGDHGNYSCFVGKGKSIAGPLSGGSYTYLEVECWSKWENRFIYGPYVHHIVGVFGDYTKSIEDACRYIGIHCDKPD